MTNNTPLFKVVYEQHPMPLEGAQLTQMQIVRAQKRADLGRIVVVEALGPNDSRYAVCANGEWRKVKFNSRVQMRKIIDALEYQESHPESEAEF